MTLCILTFLWGSRYDLSYVEKLRAGVLRHLKQPHRFLVLTERERSIQFSAGIERYAIEDPELCAVPGCFARLRIFDRGWQHDCAIDDRLGLLDLDLIVTGQLDKVFDRPETLVVFKGANASNPCPYNCSVLMLRPGNHEYLFTNFVAIKPWSEDNLRRHIPYYGFPDDQGWIWHQCGGELPHWKVGSRSGIYAFGKPGWPAGHALPSGASIVSFPGHRDPNQFTHLDWVQQHWKV